MKMKTLLPLAVGLLAGAAWASDPALGEKMVTEKNCAAGLKPINQNQKTALPGRTSGDELKENINHRYNLPG